MGLTIFGPRIQHKENKITIHSKDIHFNNYNRWIHDNHYLTSFVLCTIIKSFLCIFFLLTRKAKKISENVRIIYFETVVPNFILAWKNILIHSKSLFYKYALHLELNLNIIEVYT